MRLRRRLMTHPRLLGRGLALLTFVMLASFAVGAAEAPKDGLAPTPPLTSAVTDQTGTLSPSERQTLESKLRDWEARTTNQLAVLIVPTTAPEPIEQYSLRVAEAWKIGQKGKDNGAILLVAKNDKRIRIEVGYGLEGVLTDVTSRRIIAENVAPEFSKGNFATGINAGVDRKQIVVCNGVYPLGNHVFHCDRRHGPRWPDRVDRSHRRDRADASEPAAPTSSNARRISSRLPASSRSAPSWSSPFSPTRRRSTRFTADRPGC